MHQVLDSELFGIPASPPLPPLPPVDDDYALQRYRDPGDDIDSVLGFLGLGLPLHAGGSHMDGTADDPGGGGCWGGCPGDGTAATGGRRKTLGGQLMDSDDYDYVDYSCFSSGVTSPDLDSEFFARAISTSSMGGGPLFTGGSKLLDVASSAAYHPWEFAPISSSSSSSSGLRSHSPHYFHVDTSSDFLRLPFDRTSFAVDRSDGSRGLRGEEFDSEAEERVKEIARYLASFEVESWPNADRQMTDVASTAAATASNGGGASFFSIATSMGETNNDHSRSTATAKSGLSDGRRVFHPGYDDACCGLESTMVNPNDVFPDRIDRSDHQYASRPCSHNRTQTTARVSTDRRHPQRTTNSSGEKSTKAGGGGGGGGGGGVSVLEALLRSNQPIDPNKGSGAAIRLDATHPEQSSSSSSSCGLRCGVDQNAVHRTSSASDGVLKKLLLTARAKEVVDSSADGGGVGGGGGGSEEHGGGHSFGASSNPPPASSPVVVIGSVESGCCFGCVGVGQNFRFTETQKKSTETSEQMEFSESAKVHEVNSRNCPNDRMSRFF